MTGWYTYNKMKALEQMARDYGYSISSDRFGNADSISLYADPADETKIPIFNRNMPLFTGSLEDCYTYLYGWSKAFEYHNMLGLEKKRKAAEEKQFTDLQFAKVKHAIEKADKNAGSPF